MRRTVTVRFSCHLQVGVAVGLWSDQRPSWPLPLPPHPRKHSKKTLVLDIDETLVHTLAQRQDSRLGQNLMCYHVLLRPHVGQFLREVNDLFEVVLWTAGIASYGCAITNLLERVAGLEPSPLYDAQTMVKGSTVNPDELAKFHWYLLSRTQTLQARQWMKYIPMLGRDEKNVIMIDDNVRSFPLTPRNGIKIATYQPDGQCLDLYFAALDKYGIGPTTPPRQSYVAAPHEMESSARAEKIKECATLIGSDADAIKHFEDGLKEIHRLEGDTALLDLLPLLRSVAHSKHDAVTELNHWRADEYIRCDNFMEGCNPASIVRERTLGTVLPQRRAEPIAPLKVMANLHNVALVEEAKTMTHQAWKRNEAETQVEDKARKIAIARSSL